MYFPFEKIETQISPGNVPATEGAGLSHCKARVFRSSEATRTEGFLREDWDFLVAFAILFWHFFSFSRNNSNDDNDDDNNTHDNNNDNDNDNNNNNNNNNNNIDDDDDDDDDDNKDNNDSNK